LAAPAQSAYRTPVPARLGLSASAELVVSEADTAIAMGSGAVPVLATPRIIALAEEASVAALEGELGPGETSVGTKVQLDHVAATAVGKKVRAEASVEKVHGRRVIFTVSVSDDRGLIAVGRITRVVVDVERFLDRAR
jgi:predicted thioesterase